MIEWVENNVKGFWVICRRRRSWKKLGRRVEGGSRKHGLKRMKTCNCFLEWWILKSYQGLLKCQGSLKNSCYGARRSWRSWMCLMGNCGEIPLLFFSHVNFFFILFFLFFLLLGSTGLFLLPLLPLLLGTHKHTVPQLWISKLLWLWFNVIGRWLQISMVLGPCCYYFYYILRWIWILGFLFLMWAREEGALLVSTIQSNLLFVLELKLQNSSGPHWPNLCLLALFFCFPRPFVGREFYLLDGIMIERSLLRNVLEWFWNG